MTEQRKLAAIMAADVVGFSRLTGADEDRTLARLRTLRSDLMDPTIAVHRGRVVKRTGDGAIVEFRSVVDAVRCAIEVQNAMIERNAGVPPERRIEFRIGIHLGDVVEESDGDLMGDGVNIAARLEGVATPGAICLSEDAYRQVKTRLDFAVSDLGETRLKNIADPMRVYSLQVGVAPNAKPLPQAEPVPGPGPSLPDKPLIAVLPFLNMSGDPEQQFFSDGITEDILTELSRFRALSVIARNSSFRFRGGDVDVIRVGRELGAHYLLEGSVRRIGNKIRITAQLIDVTTGNHVWAEKFDRSQDEIFTVQDQVVRMIVGTLAGRIQAAGVEKALRKPPASLAAYEYVLRADALPFGTHESRAEVRRLSEKAIELDPAYGRAYSQLAVSYFIEWSNDYSGSDAGLDKAFSLATQAVALDDNDSNAYSTLGLVHVMRRSYDLAEQCYRKAIALNPNRPVVMASLGMLYGYEGKPDEGIAVYQQSKLIDQFYDPTWYWPTLGVLHFIAGRYDEALVHLNRSSAKPAWVHGYLAASYALTGQMAEASREADEARRGAPDITVKRLLTKEPFKQSSDQDRLRKGLLQAGLPE